MMESRRKYIGARLGAFAVSAFCMINYGIQDVLAATGHGEAEAAEHHGGGLPQLDVSTFPSQLFWLAVSFALLYMIFSKKTLPEISSVIENRQSHIESDLSMADKIKSDAENVQKTYEESLQNAREEATKVLADMQDDIKEKAEQQAASFRDKADGDVRNLEKKLNKAKQDSMDEMHTIAAELATEAAQKVVGIATDIEQAKTVIKALNGNNKAKAA